MAEGEHVSAEAVGPDGVEEVEALERLPRPLAPVSNRKKWVEDVLPWVSSGVLHLGVILALVFLVTAVRQQVAVVREQTIIPDAANVADAGPVGGIINPGLGADPNRRAAQDQVTDSTDLQVHTQRLNQALAGAPEGAGDSMLGVGAAGGGARGTAGGDSDRSGGVFGLPGGGGGGGPPASFVGVRTNALKIVYLCDASGSMLSVFPALQRQLRLSIEGLKLPQSFGVVIFSDTFKTLDNKLQLANPDNKRKASEFVTTLSASGGTKPNAGIAAAFSLQPQLIYVLTDGFDQGDPREVLEQFRKLNKDKRVKVNTILLKSADDPELVNLLKTIASENGGVYKEVDKQDF